MFCLYNNDIDMPLNINNVLPHVQGTMHLAVLFNI